VSLVKPLPTTASTIAYFANAKSALNAADKGNLVRLAQAIKADGLKHVTVAGYASAPGKSSDNSVLGIQRAKAVAAFLKAELAKLGVHGVVITTKSLGASHFVGKNPNDAQNRRATAVATK